MPANPAGEQQAGRQRPRLFDESERQPGRNERLGAESLERCPRVHRQDDTNGEAGDGNQRD
jgi:hypothetical protein